MKVKKIEINVSNDDTKYFVLKSGEDYDYYLRCMHEWGGSIITLKTMVIWKVF
jgi:hypothetical protein